MRVINILDRGHALLGGGKFADFVLNPIEDTLFPIDQQAVKVALAEDACERQRPIQVPVLPATHYQVRQLES